MKRINTRDFKSTVYCMHVSIIVPSIFLSLYLMALQLNLACFEIEMLTFQLIFGGWFLLILKGISITY